MKRITLLFCTIVLMQSSALAYGWWARNFISLSSNGTAYNYGIVMNQSWTCDNNSEWLSNLPLENHDFGTPTSLTLDGGYGEGGTDEGDYLDETSFVLYYRVYASTETPGAWSSMAFDNPYYDSGTGNKIFSKTSAGIDILSLANNVPGTYYLEVILVKNQYFGTHDSNWRTANGDQNNAFTLSESSTGYRARFSIITTKVEKTTTSPLKIFSERGAIKVNFSGEAKLKLYTATGILISSTTTHNQFYKKVDKGIYLLKFNSYTYKIIVN